jgi:hypothetical protein
MSGQKAPSGYQPTGQGAADFGYQQNTDFLANAGQQLYGATQPVFQGVLSSMQSNPYYTQAQQGADTAAYLGANYVAPGQFMGAGQDMTIGQTAMGNAQSATARAGEQYGMGVGLGGSMLGAGNAAAGKADSAYTNAMGLLPQTMTGFNTNSNQTGAVQPYVDQLNQYARFAQMAGLNSWEQAQALMPLVTSNLGAAGQILNTGFDPQGALYDRSYQQMRQQANATAGQSGLAGSPFAAGLANDASRNFNIDWQNAQLGRQTTALNAYDSAIGSDISAFSGLNTAGAGTGLTALGTAGGLTGQASGILTGAMQNDFTDSQASMNNAVNRYTGMLGGATGAYNTLNNTAQGYYGLANNYFNSGVNNYNSLMGTANNGYQTAQNAFANASDLGVQGLNTLSTSAQLPNDIYVQNQNQMLQAAQAYISGITGSLGPTQSAIGDYGNYMNIGQGATKLAQTAAQINNAQSNATWSGIGKLAGVALAPFTGGASLALTAGAGK